MLARSDSRVGTEPMAAKRTRSLPGRGHRDSIITTRHGMRSRISSSCLGHFWKAEVEKFSRASKAALPLGVLQILGRADSGFYCREAVEAYEECKAQFVISARKTSRLVAELRQAEWKPSKKTDAGWECEFRYQPEGWKKEYRFVALRYEKAHEEVETEETEQYQLFETSQYKYRVFVTDLTDPIYFVVWFYNQRGGRENLIKEANNDAGLTAHPSKRFDVNGNHFQLAMLAYN